MSPLKSKKNPVRGMEWVLFRIIWKLGLSVMALSLICFPLAESMGIERSPQEKIAEEIKRKIEKEDTPQPFTCNGELICGISVIPFFYSQRHFKPAWCGDDEKARLAQSLVNTIREAEREGLRSTDYHLVKLEALLQITQQMKAGERPSEIEKLADLDLLFTDAFLIYASHLLAGRINPETIHTKWVPFSPTVNLVAVLQSALESGDIRAALMKLRPSNSGYARLRQALQHYRDLSKKGGWPFVPYGASLKKGDLGKRVSLLQRRLAISGYFHPHGSEKTALFGEDLKEAVRRFQATHGLKRDGIVGPRTLAALNVSAKKRGRQIELNMERWRWIPHDLGERYLLVNIADFRLQAIEGTRTVMDMQVVVGRRYRRTPVFSGTMTHLVLNPFWHIPKNIAVTDILPKIKEDPNYLAKQGITVFENWMRDASAVDPRDIDWSEVDTREFPYKLRQNPGPLNALGRVKFIFPNRFSVYLHDTPAKELFGKIQRDFSSGCIRVEKPIELAVYLLRGNPRWTKEEILRVIESGQNTAAELMEPIPVHLQYWTAWAEKDGTIHFRNDIYGRDRDLDKALRDKSPRPQ
jgi:murein L,D-transpeptidase YcbB/YkuD